MASEFSERCSLEGVHHMSNKSTSAADRDLKVEISYIPLPYHSKVCVGH